MVVHLDVQLIKGFICGTDRKFGLICPHDIHNTSKPDGGVGGQETTPTFMEQ